MNTSHFITAKLAQTSPSVISLYDGDTLHNAIATSLEDTFERIHSDELAQLFFKHAKVDGASGFEAYKNRIIELPELGKAICGIRFRAMDLSKPYIDVAITEHALTAEAIKRYVQLITKEFAEFSPQYVRFFVPSHLPIDLSDFNSTSTWDRILLGNHFGNIVSRLNTLDEQGFTVEITDSTYFFPAYKNGYNELFAQKPEFKDFTSCDDEEEFKEISKNGGFNVVLKHKGVFAGLLSLYKTTTKGLSGYYMNEKFIINDFHGLGVGSAFESKAMTLLRNQGLVDDNDVLFGEIDYENKGSLHSAINNGRIIFERYLLVAC